MCCISVLTQSCLLPVSKQMVVGRAKGWSTWMFPTNSFPLIGFSQWRVFHSVSLPSAWHQKCSRDWAAGCGGCENQQLEEIPYCQPQNHSVPAIISFQFGPCKFVQELALNWSRPLPDSPKVSTSWFAFSTNTRFFPMSPTNILPQ